jgi:hypothetical protein
MHGMDLIILNPDEAPHSGLVDMAKFDEWLDLFAEERSRSQQLTTFRRGVPAQCRDKSASYERSAYSASRSALNA